MNKEPMIWLSENDDVAVGLPQCCTESHDAAQKSHNVVLKATMWHKKATSGLAELVGVLFYSGNVEYW